MKSGSYFKKGIASLLIMMMLVNISGCSEFLMKRAVEKATEYVEGVFEDLKKDPEKTITKNSQTEVEFPELTAEQGDVVDELFSSLSFDIDEVKLNEKRTKGTVTIALDLIPVFEEDTFIVGTADEVNDQIDDLKQDIVLDFDIKLDKNKNWVFADLSELAGLLMDPYQEICFLNEDGNPINITKGYIDMVYVDSAWFDPLMNNPLSENRLSGTDYLKVGFYFNRPMTIDFTFDVLYNGEVSQTLEISLEEEIIADCHLESEQGFEAGSYQIILYYGDTVVAESEELTVR